MSLISLLDLASHAYLYQEPDVWSWATEAVLSVLTETSPGLWELYDTWAW